MFSSPPARHSDLDAPSQQQARISASCATRELDELMASLSDFKVPSSRREASPYQTNSSFLCHLPHDLSVLFLSASLSCSPVLWALCWTQQEPPPALLTLQSLPPSPPRLLLSSVCPARLPVPPLSSLCLLVSSCTSMRTEETAACRCPIRTIRPPTVPYPPFLQPVTQTWTRPPCCHLKLRLCSSSVSPPTPA